jgi:hypothetical protein
MFHYLLLYVFNVSFIASMNLYAVKCNASQLIYICMRERKRKRESETQDIVFLKICDGAKKFKTDHNLSLIVDFCERSFRNSKFKFNFLLHFGREAEDENHVEKNA